MTDAPHYPHTHARAQPDSGEAPVTRKYQQTTGFGSAIGVFLALMVLFVLAAGVAQLAVHDDRDVGVRDPVTEAPRAPPVEEDVVPAQPAPPADGNPAGQVSPDAVTP